MALRTPLTKPTRRSLDEAAAGSVLWESLCRRRSARRPYSAGVRGINSLSYFTVWPVAFCSHPAEPHSRQFPSTQGHERPSLYSSCFVSPSSKARIQSHNLRDLFLSRCGRSKAPLCDERETTSISALPTSRELRSDVRARRGCLLYPSRIPTARLPNCRPRRSAQGKDTVATSKRRAHELWPRLAACHYFPHTT